MEIKAKICKGAGRAKDFNGCGTSSVWRKYGLCKKCYGDWLYNTSEGDKIIQKSLNRAKKQIEKEAKRKRKKEKEQLIDYKAKLQSKINEIVRLIDIGLPCLARGVHVNQVHAGHIFSRGSNPQMKFNLHNEHRQGAQSNHFQNEDGKLRDGLIKEYGQDYYEFIKSMQGLEPLKYSNKEYKEFYKKASEISLRLKKQGERYSKKERIEMRNKINLELEIYSENDCVFMQQYNHSQTQ